MLRRVWRWRSIGDFDGDRDADIVGFDLSNKTLNLFVNSERQVFRASQPPARIGTTIRLLPYADVGHLVVPVLGTRIRPSVVPRPGTLWLDPAAMLVISAVRIPPGR